MIPENFAACLEEVSQHIQQSTLLDKETKQHTKEVFDECIRISEFVRITDEISFLTKSSSLSEEKKKEMLDKIRKLPKNHLKFYTIKHDKK